MFAFHVKRWQWIIFVAKIYLTLFVTSFNTRFSWLTLNISADSTYLLFCFLTSILFYLNKVSENGFQKFFDKIILTSKKTAVKKLIINEKVRNNFSLKSSLSKVLFKTTIKSHETLDCIRGRWCLCSTYTWRVITETLISFG